MSEENQNKMLLEEYKLCQSAAERLESTIWQTSAAIGTGSIGTFILIANRTVEEQPPLPVVAIIALLILFASVVWWLMARR